MPTQTRTLKTTNPAGRPPSARRTRTIAAVGFVLLSVTWLVLRPSGHRPTEFAPADPAPADIATPVTTEPGPDPLALGPRNVDLIETAAAADRDANGARAAAFALLELGEQASTMARADVESLWRAIATPESVDALVADNLAAYDAARARFPDGAPTRYIPLASRVELDGDDRARVDLWFLLVIEIPDGPAAQAWTTGTYELVWHEDRWRIAAVRAIDGPTPALQAATQTVTSATLRSLLAGFDPA